jgi:hypothetical protein
VKGGRGQRFRGEEEVARQGHPELERPDTVADGAKRVVPAAARTNYDAVQVPLAAGSCGGLPSRALVFDEQLYGRQTAVGMMHQKASYKTHSDLGGFCVARKR